ncbi:pollen-specific leucine-rich repeat extensin-like protein 2 isoform X1 [Pieris rapae]|uniref:pollen-specific leucine-rich repeat extensin-like protein 2 isoform X1 n=1 Tax=Pieris rapae TaxID=64459 RepID=UPI001E27BEA4|nr:pollen-specific leucine-rich repeat extensin-like protein 2 isoform X1 [Pieris rapae]
MFIRNHLIVMIILLLRGGAAEPSPRQFKYTPGPSISAPVFTDPRESLSSIASIFSPRMDFDQWKPLTGRGDPLHNDPTYDYEPPMLERVHYWADDSRLEREHYPEKKSEVLMLGVSSRKPSVSSRPPTPPKRSNTPPPKYEDYSYKLTEYYPMTILVPPPPPPVGYKPSLFIPPENKIVRPTPPTHIEPTFPPRYTISTPELITSFALQEANLIYEATDSNQTWFSEPNKTHTDPSNTVSSDYAGWGPTTPFNERNTHNDLSNLIPHREFIGDLLTHSFYSTSAANIHAEATQPTISETTTVTPTFLPTALPPAKSTTSDSKETWPYYEQSSGEATTESSFDFGETTTDTETTTVRSQAGAVDMLGAMMSMPMVADSERPEDNLYAHASENIQVFKDHVTEAFKLEAMQTMHPPPPDTFQTSTVPPYRHQINPHHLNGLLHEDQPSQTIDPYLHMRFTTPLTTTIEPVLYKSTTESSPMYLIIQGHSKVKTYGSQPNPASNSITDFDITKPQETQEVKHLHPLKDKYLKKTEIKENRRKSRSQNLTSLIEAGVGSIEIQEADVGIKYDVSDGSKVPVEIYRKGIVENDDSNYSFSKKNHIKRDRRQIDINDLIPIDEDTIEELVYNFFETRKNNTGLTGFIAKAITGDVSTAVQYALKEDNEDHSEAKR